AEDEVEAVQAAEPVLARQCVRDGTDFLARRRAGPEGHDVAGVPEAPAGPELLGPSQDDASPAVAQEGGRAAHAVDELLKNLARRGSLSLPGMHALSTAAARGFEEPLAGVGQGIGRHAGVRYGESAACEKPEQPDRIAHS